MPKLDAALIDALGEPMPELEQLSAASQKKLAADLAAAHQAHDAFLKKAWTTRWNTFPACCAAPSKNSGTVNHGQKH